MARKKKAAVEPALTVTEPPKAVYAEGYRTWLYHAFEPAGRIFTGEEANAALAEGWVDHPDKIGKTAGK